MDLEEKCQSKNFFQLTEADYKSILYCILNKNELIMLWLYINCLSFKNVPNKEYKQKYNQLKIRSTNIPLYNPADYDQFDGHCKTFLKDIETDNYIIPKARSMRPAKETSITDEIFKNNELKKIITEEFFNSIQENCNNLNDDNLSTNIQNSIQTVRSNFRKLLSDKGIKIIDSKCEGMESIRDDLVLIRNYGCPDSCIRVDSVFKGRC